MPWYGASALIATRLMDAPEECPLIEERIYLIDADDEIVALEKAIAFAKAEVVEEYRFEYEGRKAKEEFLGIRKLLTVSSHVRERSGNGENIKEGSEISFSYFKLKSRKDIAALVSGEPVELTYVE